MTLKFIAATSFLSLSLLGTASFAQTTDAVFEGEQQMAEMSLQEGEMVDAAYRDRDRRPGRNFWQCSAHGVRNNRRLFYGEVFRNRDRAARSALNTCYQYRNNCVLYQCLRVR